MAYSRPCPLCGVEFSTIPTGGRGTELEVHAANCTGFPEIHPEPEFTPDMLGPETGGPGDIDQDTETCRAQCYVVADLGVCQMYPLSAVGKEQYERTGHVVLSGSFLEMLTQRETPYPWFFELEFIGRGDKPPVYVGVMEFHREEAAMYGEKAFIPQWIAENLGIEHLHGQSLMCRSVRMSQMQQLSLCWQDEDWLNVDHPELVLEQTLKNMACLAIGDIIPVFYEDKAFKMEVISLNEGAVGAACCLDLTGERPEVKLDFVAPEWFLTKMQEQQRQRMEEKAKEEARKEMEKAKKEEELRKAKEAIEKERKEQRAKGKLRWWEEDEVVTPLGMPPGFRPFSSGKGHTFYSPGIGGLSRERPKRIGPIVSKEAQVPQMDSPPLSREERRVRALVAAERRRKKMESKL